MSRVGRISDLDRNNDKKDEGEEFQQSGSGTGSGTAVMRRPRDRDDTVNAADLVDMARQQR